MKWWKQTNTWILIGIGIGVILCILACLNYSKEGFQILRSMTSSNITYPFHEVFLVAPTNAIERMDIYTPQKDNNYINKGYTFEEARAFCQSLGMNSEDLSPSMPKADLATPAQLKTAYDMSGNWCLKGWASDGKVYILPNSQNKCGTDPITTTTTSTSTPPIITTTTAFKLTETNPVIDPSGNIARAFPICYAPKQPEPTAYAQPFNVFQYSMISEGILNKVMYGTGKDIFPKQFSADQAYYALHDNSYNPVKAREYLINKFDTVNQTIIEKVDTSYSDKAEEWSTGTVAVSTSCNSLQAIDTDYSNKLNKLRDLFKDVSGTVTSVMWAKSENANIQATVYDACYATTPVKSPACAKLATIDFDLFYTDPTYSTLSELETLNYYRFLREQELCTSIVNLRIVKNIIGCTYTSIVTDCRGVSDNMGEFDPTSSQFKYSDETTKTGMKTYMDFDINNVEALKYVLTEISPLFQVTAYKGILENVLERLSFILRTPSLADFANSSIKFDQIGKAITDIRSLLSLSKYTGS